MLLTSCQEEAVESIYPKRQQITEAVYASATILPVDYYAAYAEASGIVDAKWVSAGDSIQKGDKLYTVRNESIDLQLANAQLSVQEASDDFSGSTSRIQDLERQINFDKQQYQQDSIDYQRQNSLWEKGIGSHRQLEQTQLKFQASRTQLLSAINALAQSRRNLQNRLDRARNNYQISSRNQGQFVLKSRINGLVYATQVEAGETVGPQQALAMIGRRDTFLVEMQIDEEDISRVQIGQKVYLTLDSYPDEVYEAKLSKIYPIMNASSQSFRIEAAFVSRPVRLYPNLTAEANIVVNTLSDALVIPRSYVLAGDSVMTLEGQKIPVVTGLHDLQYVEIKSGLKDESIALRKPE